MDILIGIVEAIVTLAVIAIIGIVMAGLFITILSLATGIDGNIQPEDDRSS